MLRYLVPIPWLNTYIARIVHPVDCLVSPETFCRVPSMYLLVVAETVDVSKVGSQVVMPKGLRAVRELSMCVLELAVKLR